MPALCKGRYVARLARGEADTRAAQDLRTLAFGAARADQRDCDAYDAICRHVLVEDVASGTLVCCYRLLPLQGGHEIGRSYSAQFYDLSALSAFAAPMLELGRFCTHPDWHDPDILRLAWAAMTRFVDANAVALLFGCTSFQGTRAEAYIDAFAMLGQGHLAPQHWRPRIKAATVFRYTQCLRQHQPDGRRALQAMPPLLRTYLMMGGWVSDHAVVDPQMNTLHVFTGLEISAIPPARARLLRALAS